MAIRPKINCRHPGCRNLIDAPGFCATHVKAHGWNANKPRSDKRGYGSEWRRTRELALDRDLGLCQECKRQGRLKVGTDVDHIIPKSRGGTDDLSNLQTLCRECHKEKTYSERKRVWR